MLMFNVVLYDQRDERMPRIMTADGSWVVDQWSNAAVSFIVMLFRSGDSVLLCEYVCVCGFNDVAP